MLGECNLESYIAWTGAIVVCKSRHGVTDVTVLVPYGGMYVYGFHVSLGLIIHLPV